VPGVQVPWYVLCWLHPLSPYTDALAYPPSPLPSSHPPLLHPTHLITGAPKTKAAYPLLLHAHSEYNYFEKRDAWASLRAQLMSPMTWMLFVSVAAAFFLPKAMDSMSEEEKKALEEQMKTTNPTAMLQDLMGGGGAGGGAGGGGSGKKKGGGEGKKQN